MMTITSEQLEKLGIGAEWLEPLTETFEKYDISTPKRQACFIGQCMHESGGFKILQENLNYSAKGLVATWPSRFPSEEYAQEYARKPERIASKVYVGRMGNETPEDAAKYIGRGLIQLTGKENYANCGLGIGVDLLGNPDWLAIPKYAAFSAGWYWNKRNINSDADAGNIESMTRKINGGNIGIEDRKAKINMVLNAIGS
jgi:putative chitinase